MAFSYDLPRINPNLSEDLYEHVELNMIDLPAGLAGMLAYTDYKPPTHIPDYATPEGLAAGREVLTNLLEAAPLYRDIKPGSAAGLERERSTLETFASAAVAKLGGRVEQADVHGHVSAWEVPARPDTPPLLMRVGKIAGFSLTERDAESVFPGLQSDEPQPNRPKVVDAAHLAPKGAYRTLFRLLHIDVTLNVLELRQSHPRDPGDPAELQRFWREKGLHLVREEGGPRALAAEYLSRFTKKMGAQIVQAPQPEGGV